MIKSHWQWNKFSDYLVSISESFSDKKKNIFTFYVSVYEYNIQIFDIPYYNREEQSVQEIIIYEVYK